MVRADPGCSTEELAAALGVDYDAAFYEGLLRLGRSLGVGQDVRGCWWHHEDHDEIREQFNRGLPASAWPDE